MADLSRRGSEGLISLLFAVAGILAVWGIRGLILPSLNIAGVTFLQAPWSDFTAYSAYISLLILLVLVFITQGESLKRWLDTAALSLSLLYLVWLLLTLLFVEQATDPSAAIALVVFVISIPLTYLWAKANPAFVARIVKILTISTLILSPILLAFGSAAVK